MDLSQFELQNARIQNLSTAPSSPVKGQTYFNTTSNTWQYFDGTAYQTVGSGSGSGNVTKSSNSAAANTLQVSGGADKSIADYAPGSAGLIKTTSAGVPSTATAGTDYVTGYSTNTFTNKGFDAAGTGSSLSNISTTNLASGVL